MAFNLQCLDLVQGTLMKDLKKNIGASPSFRPLYNSGSDKVQKHLGKKTQKKDSIEDLKKRSFKNGFEAGQKNAGNLAIEELDPAIRSLSAELNNYLKCYKKIKDLYAPQIIELSLAIIKRVLGDNSNLSIKNSESVHREIELFLSEKYRLTLKCNSEDFSAVSNLMTKLEPNWNTSEAVQMVGEDDIKRGQVKATVSDKAVENTYNQFDHSLELEMSTK